MPLKGRSTIQDLPDEILDQIVAEVKWGWPSITTHSFNLDGLRFYENLVGNTGSIQSLRLTCRRFATRAAPVALPVASVHLMDPDSISRFEELSRHATFSRHVQAVRVYLCFYEAGLAEKIEGVTDQDGEDCSALELSKSFNDQPHLQERSVMASERPRRWRISSAALPEYRRRYEAQQALRETGSGVRRVAEATACMPHATRLIFEDDSPRQRLADPRTATPLSWRAAFKNGFGAPPVEGLVNLPVEMHKAGVELTGLCIRLRVPDELPLWIWDDSVPLFPPLPQLIATEDEFASACRALRVLEFTPDYEPDCWPRPSPRSLRWPGSRDPVERTRLADLLDLMLSGATALRELHLDGEMAKGSKEHVEELIFPSQPWPQIERLVYKNLPLPMDRTAPFLEMAVAKRNLSLLRLEGMHLYCGADYLPISWTRTLDRLRPFSNRMRENQERVRRKRSGKAGAAESELPLRIRDPRGAEMWVSDVSVQDRAAIGALFDEQAGGCSGGLSEVDMYINGLTASNPLVERGLSDRDYWN